MSSNPTPHSQALAVLLPGGDVPPVTHGVHAAGPTVSLNVSAAHSKHGPPAGPEKPGTHEQFSGLVEAASDVAFLLHATQLALPALALNEPARQATQAPGTPLKPGAHAQAAKEVLAAGEMELVG